MFVVTEISEYEKEHAMPVGVKVGKDIKERALQLRAGGLSLRDIADRLGVSISVVSRCGASLRSTPSPKDRKCRECGVTNPPSGFYTTTYRKTDGLPVYSTDCRDCRKLIVRRRKQPQAVELPKNEAEAIEVPKEPVAVVCGRVEADYGTA